MRSVVCVQLRTSVRSRVCIFVLLCLLPEAGRAYPSYQARVPNGQQQAWGHVNPAGGGARNQFGRDFGTAGKVWTPQLCAADSDGDGLSNGLELGDPDCEWSEGQTPRYTTGIRHPGVPTGDVQEAGYDSCAEADIPANASTVRFNFTEHPVAAVETKYVCAPMRFPSDMKRWIRKFSPVLDNAEVHHILIYKCDVPVANSSPNCLDMAASCPTIIYAWAVGASDFCLPPGLGIPVGPGFAQHMVMEIHYDNPTMKEGVFDSSGVEMSLVEDDPGVDAGLLMVGEPGILSLPSSLAPAIQGVRVNPGEASHNFSTTCPSTCTSSKVPQDGLTVVATFSHAHQAGRKLHVRRVGTDGTTGFLIKDDDFDFDLQQIVPLRPADYKKIEKGDTLTVSCTFDTTRRGDVVTVSGEASDQEMWYVFVSPAAPGLCA